MGYNWQYQLWEHLKYVRHVEIQVRNTPMCGDVMNVAESIVIGVIRLDVQDVGLRI